MDNLNNEIEENENKEKSFISKLNKKIKFTIIIIIFIILAVIIIFVNRKPEFSSKSQMYSVEKICELATLECYYHDVAEYRREATGIFHFGFKKYLIISVNGFIYIQKKLYIQRPWKTFISC